MTRASNSGDRWSRARIIAGLAAAQDLLGKPFDRAVSSDPGRQLWIARRRLDGHRSANVRGG
jgi:hypothetical protein